MASVRKFFTALYGMRFGLWRSFRQVFLGDDPDFFLKQCTSVLHVGANVGGERKHYDKLGLSVVWVEALPRLYEQLVKNLAGRPNHKAINALVTDKEGETYKFNVASNAGASSSVFEFKDHKTLWPDVTYSEAVELRSTTLESMLTAHGYKPGDFQALVMDVQGAELLVVKGAGEFLKTFRFIRAEASDFESYAGACTLQSLTDALIQQGFVLRRQDCFARKRGVGSYYDVLYERA